MAAAPCVVCGARAQMLAMPVPNVIRSVAGSSSASCTKGSLPPTGLVDPGGPVACALQTAGRLALELHRRHAGERQRQVGADRPQ
jgi:hypothetical protein